MQLPKYKKGRKKDKLHICGELGCGKEFWGHTISKYCEIHRDIRNRKRRRRIHEEPDIKNQIFKHHHSQVIDVRFICALKGCLKEFTVKVYPKQFVYPKYCEEHRHEHKRLMFLRSKDENSL